jgi:hypothetical protein
MRATMAIETSTGISVQNVIELLNSLSLMVGILAVGFTLVATIAVWRTSKDGAWAFFRMFERLQVLQMLTVMLVIASATILAMLGILNSNGITGILSGVAGYVLGGLTKQGNPVQSSTAPVTAIATPSDNQKS